MQKKWDGWGVADEMLLLLSPSVSQQAISQISVCYFCRGICVVQVKEGCICQIDVLASNC